MNNLISLDRVKDLEVDKNLELGINRNKNEFQNIISNVIDKGTDYAIKAMPVNDHIKDILIDVKKSFKTGDFKEIIKTAVNSSIREGLELLSIPRNVIKDITKIKDVALKGGLSSALSAGIDIVTNKYLKGNLFAPYIKSFVSKTKEFLFSNAFKEKIDAGIKNVSNRVDKYKSLCENWYSAYEKFDIDSINSIAKSLKYQRRNIVTDKSCIEENNVIQNMTQLINNKRDKLSKIQLQICGNL